MEAIYINKIQNYYKKNNVYKLYKYITKLLIIKNNKLGGLNVLYVYDKINKLIDKVPYDIYQKYSNEFIILNNYDFLLELSKENNNRIIKEIKKNGKNKMYHVSIYPLKEIADTNTNDESWAGQSSVYNNPIGLWLGCGDSWQKFMNNKLAKWALSKYIYEFTLSNTVLQIHNITEFESFVHKYKNPVKKLDIRNVINWKKVKKDYDGLIICPYLGHEIWGTNANDFTLYGNPVAVTDYITQIVGDSWKTKLFFLAEWYRHWDAASGIIWRKTGIQDFNLVKQLDTFDNIEARIENYKPPNEIKSTETTDTDTNSSITTT